MATKMEVRNYTRKLYRFLDEGHRITFKRLRKYRGSILTHQFPTQLHLDYRNELIPTLIHESLHYFYPEKSEAWILEHEKIISNRLTERQVKNILKRFVNAF
jgi:hypothetical protein